jgi:hypothetical protein
MSLIGGKEPGILESGDDAYRFAALPQDGAGLKWRKVGTRKSGYLTFLGEKYRRDGNGAAVLQDGRTLEHRGRHWTLPGKVLTRAAIPGVQLADGLNFIVPIRVKDDYSTYLCRPDGKTGVIWPGYFQLTQNLSITPDGTIWGVERRSPPRIGRHPDIGMVSVNLFLLTHEGQAISDINTDGILQKAGITYGDIWPLRAKDGYLWFNAGNMYLVKAEINNINNTEFWRLPKVIREQLQTVVPSVDGIFITAADGVYFMDWDGIKKKIY